MKDWQELLKLTGGRQIIVERVKLVADDIAIEGAFQLPPLANLSSDDQVFVAAFVKSHGSIKQMEKYFGVSYPTIKNRLNRLGERLDFVEIESADAEEPEKPDRLAVLERLDKGEITFDEAMNLLGEGGNDD